MRIVRRARYTKRLTNGAFPRRSNIRNIIAHAPCHPRQFRRGAGAGPTNRSEVCVPAILN